MNPLLRGAPKPFHSTRLGMLFAGDCLELLPCVRDGVVDTVFADPPFNLSKKYGKHSGNDRRSREDYLAWCRSWIDQCARALAPGGAFWLWNLPKWNVQLGAHLDSIGLEFQNWIAVDLTLTPVAGKRFYPSHYSLLYYTKGEPKTFHPIRTPIAACRHCGGDIKDYGGYRAKLAKDGLRLKDVWTDIPPVRHKKYMNRKRRANALSTKILDRVVECSTEPGDLVLDPFMGSGTTAAVCEAKGRRWIGVEIDFAKEIVSRLEEKVPHHRNDDRVESVAARPNGALR